MISACYLIRNDNGFEDPVEEGAKAYLETLRGRLEKEENESHAGIKGSVRYYVILKQEWDISNCPIMPVDLS
jgi:hypothetical protein